MILRQILRELERIRGPVRLEELSLRLGVERSALEAMIDFWVRKGRLKEERAAALVGNCADGECPESCPGTKSCPLVPRLPHSFSRVVHDE
jgi:hypothetical protein